VGLELGGPVGRPADHVVEECRLQALLDDEETRHATRPFIVALATP